MTYLKKSTRQALIIKEMLYAQRFLVESLQNDGEPVHGRSWSEWRDLLTKGAKQLQELGIDIYKIEDTIKQVN